MTNQVYSRLKSMVLLSDDLERNRALSILVLSLVGEGLGEGLLLKKVEEL